MKLVNFIKFLLVELSVNGKLLMGYLITQVPSLTQYPGLKTALETFLNNPSKENFIALAFQAFLAGAAGHRILKIVTSLMKK